MQALHALLSKTAAELRALGGVNLKAMDQHVTFVQQRQDLVKRQAENDKCVGPC